MPVQIASEEDVPSISDKGKFSALLDKTFGAGKWRITGDYRTKARENELRAEGAQTVAPGETSHHSMGTPDAPGAYDVVVDGLNPRQVARRLLDTGADFVHFYPEDTRGTQGAHLHVDVTPGGARPQAQESGPVRIASVEDAPPEKPAAPKAKPQPSLLHQIAEPFRDIPREAAKQTNAANAELARRNAVDEQIARDRAKKGLPQSTLADIPRQLGDLGAVAERIFAPVEGALTSIIGRPAELITGAPRKTVADVAQLAIPVAGEVGMGLKAGKLAEEAGVGTNYARKIIADQRARAALPVPKAQAAKPTFAQTAAAVGPTNAAKALAQPVEAEHAARVARLEKDGIALTPGMKLGGKAKIIEDASTSNPYRGQAVADARNHAIETFNTAVYNRALAPLGERFPSSLRPGRDGVKYVNQKLSAAYDAILPKIRVNMDDQTVAQLAQLEKAADKLGPNEASRFKAIVNQDVLHHMPIGQVIDGETFKSVQSDLLRQARAAKGSPDPNQRDLGYMLEDVLDALTTSAERHSPKEASETLRKINNGWAIFTRIQDAATRRTVTPEGATPGVFSPGDLVASVKKGDKSVRKGAFARGDALLQGFAEDAEAVLPSKVGDSGTATRMNVTRSAMGGGGIGAVVGGPHGALVGAGAGAARAIGETGARAGANALSSHLLSSSRAPVAKNYLLAAKRRLDSHNAARAVSAAAGAIDAGEQQ